MQAGQYTARQQAWFAKILAHYFVNNYPYKSRTQLKARVPNVARTLKEKGLIQSIKQVQDELDRQLSMRAMRAERQDRSGDPLHGRKPGQAHTRVNEMLLHICQQEIDRRGISEPTGWSDATPHITDHDSSRRLWIVHDEYRYHYSNRFGDWWTGASYLCGHEDGQYWVVRVPRTITTVDAALEWHTPAAVKKAQEEGRWVRRQGDVYLVALKRGKDNLRDLPDRHHFREETRYLVHPEHKPVKLPNAPVKAFSARTLEGTTAD